jgi:hypothetical protein
VEADLKNCFAAMHTPLHNTNTKSMSTKLFYDCTTSNSVDVERMSVETETLCILQKLGVGDVGSMVTSDIQFVQYYHYRLLSISSLHRQVLKFVRQYRQQAGGTCGYAYFTSALPSGCTQ